jgi:GT2 family glycosyltransferase
MKFAVVIVTYNRLSLLNECVERVLSQSYPVEKIVVVNNNSSDGTKEYLDKFISDSRFHIYNSETNNGGAWGFYKGIEISQNYNCDYILLIDDDAIIENNFFEVMEKYINRYSTYDAYSSTVYVDKTIDIGHRMNLVNKLFIKFSPVELRKYNEECFECDTATFCGLLLKKDLINKIGLPEKDYFIWFDDMEYCLRILRHTKILNINEAIIQHKTIAPFEKAPITWKNFYGERNYLLMVKKHFSFISYSYVIIRKVAKMFSLKLKCLLYKKNYKYNYKLLCSAIKEAINGNKGVNYKYFPK